MMPGIWVVLVPVTPFPAAISPGELRTAERADLADPGDCYGGLIVCHLRDPLRRRLTVHLTWRAWCRRSGGPGSGMQSQRPACARKMRCPYSSKAKAHPRRRYWQGHRLPSRQRRHGNTPRPESSITPPQRPATPTTARAVDHLMTRSTARSSRTTIKGELYGQQALVFWCNRSRTR
jgi:hypothetical protein